MSTDSRLVQGIHDEWAARQPVDAPVFGGPDGNLYYADDGAFWDLIERASTDQARSAREDEAADASRTTGTTSRRS